MPSQRAFIRGGRVPIRVPAAVGASRSRPLPSRRRDGSASRCCSSAPVQAAARLRRRLRVRPNACSGPRSGPRRHACCAAAVPAVATAGTRGWSYLHEATLPQLLQVRLRTGKGGASHEKEGVWLVGGGVVAGVRRVPRTPAPHRHGDTPPRDSNFMPDGSGGCMTCPDGSGCKKGDDNCGKACPTCAADYATIPHASYGADIDHFCRPCAEYDVAVVRTDLKPTNTRGWSRCSFSSSEYCLPANDDDATCISGCDPNNPTKINPLAGRWEFQITALSDKSLRTATQTLFCEVPPVPM